MTVPALVQAVLVTGRSATRREALIAGMIIPGTVAAVLAEGLPNGSDPFGGVDASVHVARVAPACPCCTGLLTARVTINRLLRHHPNQLFISLAPASHAATVAQMLSSEPYSGLVGIIRIVDSDNS